MQAHLFDCMLLKICFFSSFDHTEMEGPLHPIPLDFHISDLSVPRITYISITLG